MKKTARTLVYCLIAFTLIAPCALSHGLAETTPRSVGLSQDRLAEITALMQKHVDEEKLAGAVAAVARRGKIAYLEIDQMLFSCTVPHHRLCLSLNGANSLCFL